MSSPEPGPASLNATRRERELAWLRDIGRIDVLVVGAGVTGAGVALDAAARGLTVALVDRHDLAFGTSRWSSKLVHGGLRYLASGEVSIAYESAVERDILLRRTAPHLVRPFPQLVPLLPGVPRTVIRAGYLGGDLLRRAAGTSGALLPHSRRISPAETRRYAPTLRVDRLRGGILGWDGQLYDDARLVVCLARTAASLGAAVLTRCAAEQVTGDGAVLRDGLTGERFDVAARVVVNATGVWAGRVASGIALRPSRGSHLVLSQEQFGGLSAGLTIPVPGERNRFVFVLPAPNRRVYLGLTDEDAPGEVPDVPEVTDTEIDFLLAVVNRALRVPVSHHDILGSFAGLRPLLDNGDGARTADLSRRHAVITSLDGLVTVIGGKLTTYRKMAQHALDTALERRGVAAGPCVTHRLALVGAAGHTRVAASPRLISKYGGEAPMVLAEARGDTTLLVPIADGIETTEAELRFAVRHEGALDVADLLDRRTRIGLVPTDRSRAVPTAERVLAEV
ncbi:MAG TPA: glycerol-3-phosphate dehydrogenase/oxidase [Micromonosporaceae bacterium]|jgi:glycerol-3-phosphate dehydrogenase|nr:glycerol-3-phosphate dehydrogenase/oxidase [Micromonosporaceae bacterium]